MRTTLVVLVTLGLAWIGYVVWPLHDLFQLARAIERADVAEVRRHVDFPRVTHSLAQQIVEAYLQRTGTRAGPLLPGAVASIADPIVAKLTSPDALTELLRDGWPRDVLPERPSDALGVSVDGLGTAWQVFVASEYGIGRYEVPVPVAQPPERAFLLQLRLVRWRWRLSGVRLPERVRFGLADELIKLTRPPTQ